MLVKIKPIFLWRYISSVSFLIIRVSFFLKPVIVHNHGHVLTDKDIEIFIFYFYVDTSRTKFWRLIRLIHLQSSRLYIRNKILSKTVTNRNPPLFCYWLSLLLMFKKCDSLFPLQLFVVIQRNTIFQLCFCIKNRHLTVYLHIFHSYVLYLKREN